MREKDEVKPQPEGKPAKGLKLTLSADKTETLMKPDGSDALPVNLKLTFTNVSDKDVTLNTYLLYWRLRLRCMGPSPDSVIASALYVTKPNGPFLPTPTAKDSIVISSGKSWSLGWTPAFPGTIDEGYAKYVIFALRRAGTYKLRVTLYENLLAGDEEEAKLNRWLDSNELELKVREKDEVKPQPEGKPAKGLKLTLSADKTETRMKPDGSNAEPVKLKLTFANTSDKPIKLNAYALPYRVELRCIGPTSDSVGKRTAHIDLVLKAPTEEDSPVIQPGKSWSSKWTPSFPDGIPDGYGKINSYTLRKPGTYKLRFILYEDLFGADSQKGKPLVWLESNEFDLKVLDKKRPTAAPGK